MKDSQRAISATVLCLFESTLKHNPFMLDAKKCIWFSPRTLLHFVFFRKFDWQPTKAAKQRTISSHPCSAPTTNDYRLRLLVLPLHTSSTTLNSSICSFKRAVLANQRVACLPPTAPKKTTQYRSKYPPARMTRAAAP